MACLRLLLAPLTWTHAAAQSPYLTIFSHLSYFSHSRLIRQQSLVKAGVAWSGVGILALALGVGVGLLNLIPIGHPLAGALARVCSMSRIRQQNLKAHLPTT